MAKGFDYQYIVIGSGAAGGARGGRGGSIGGENAIVGGGRRGGKKPKYPGIS